MSKDGFDSFFKGSRKGTRDALFRHLDKEIKKNNRTKRTNASPEKEVEKLCMDWLQRNGFDCCVVEAKASFSEKTQRYTSQSVAPGFPDICGNTVDGIAVWIELKAPGRRSTIRPKQAEFLERKIKMKCFAVCVDTPERLDHYWKAWNSHIRAGQNALAVKFLLDALPRKRSKRGQNEADCFMPDDDLDFL